MRTLLEEIRNQPAHIREIFMWLSVVIVFSAVSFFWFQSTAKQFVALVNPQKAKDDRALAQKNKLEQQSVLAVIGQSADTLKDGIAEFFGFTEDKTTEFIGSYRSEPIPPNLFPTSNDK